MVVPRLDSRCGRVSARVGENISVSGGECIAKANERQCIAKKEKKAQLAVIGKAMVASLRDGKRVEECVITYNQAKALFEI